MVHELLRHWPGEAMRYLLLSAHYRQPLDWSESALRQAVTTLDRLYRVLEDHPAEQAAKPAATVVEALDDDLNTPAALAALNALARELGQCEDPAQHARLAGELRASGELLGLLQQPAQWTEQRQAEAGLDPDHIDRLVAQRTEARQQRNFAEADRLRDELDEMGVELEDSAEGTRWRVKARESGQATET